MIRVDRANFAAPMEQSAGLIEVNRPSHIIGDCRSSCPGLAMLSTWTVSSTGMLSRWRSRALRVREMPIFVRIQPSDDGSMCCLSVPVAKYSNAEMVGCSARSFCTNCTSEWRGSSYADKPNYDQRAGTRDNRCNLLRGRIGSKSTSWRRAKKYR